MQRASRQLLFSAICSFGIAVCVFIGLRERKMQSVPPGMYSYQIRFEALDDRLPIANADMAWGYEDIARNRTIVGGGKTDWRGKVDLLIPAEIEEVVWRPGTVVYLEIDRKGKKYRCLLSPSMFPPMRSKVKVYVKAAVATSN